jgi:hypothetical protein
MLGRSIRHWTSWTIFRLLHCFRENRGTTIFVNLWQKRRNGDSNFRSAGVEIGDSGVALNVFRLSEVYLRCPNLAGFWPVVGSDQWPQITRLFIIDCTITTRSLKSLTPGYDAQLFPWPDLAGFGRIDRPGGREFRRYEVAGPFPCRSTSPIFSSSAKSRRA